MSQDDIEAAVPGGWADLVRKHNEQVEKLVFPDELPRVRPRDFCGLFT
jgi:hypothetical protein